MPRTLGAIVGKHQPSVFWDVLAASRPIAGSAIGLGAIVGKAIRGLDYLATSQPIANSAIGLTRLMSRAQALPREVAVMF